MANVVTILHPDLIVLGGSVAQLGPILFDTVEQTVRQRVGMFPPDDVKIVDSALGTRVGLLDGIALAMKQGLLT